MADEKQETVITTWDRQDLDNAIDTRVRGRLGEVVRVEVKRQVDEMTTQPVLAKRMILDALRECRYDELSMNVGSLVGTLRAVAILLGATKEDFRA